MLAEVYGLQQTWKLEATGQATLIINNNLDETELCDADQRRTLPRRQKCVIGSLRRRDDRRGTRQSDLLASNIPRDPHLR